VFPPLPGFQGRLGLLNLLQPLFPPRQLLAHLVPIGLGTVFLVLLLVGGFRRLQQPLDLLPQPLLLPQHAAVAHGFVLGGVGVYFGAVQGHGAQAGQPQGSGQLHRLRKDLLHVLLVPLPELDEGAEGRGLHARQVLEGQVLLAGPLELAGAEDAHRKPVKNHLQHEARVVGRLAQVAVASFQGAESLP
jgi:hypothetical protein